MFVLPKNKRGFSASTLQHACHLQRLLSDALWLFKFSLFNTFSHFLSIFAFSCHKSLSGMCVFVPKINYASINFFFSFSVKVTK